MCTHAHAHACTRTHARTRTRTRTRVRTRHTTQALGNLATLSDLELDGNPIATAPGYKHSVVNHLAELKRLDGEMLSSKDHEDASHFVAYQSRRGQVLSHACSRRALSLPPSRTYVRVHIRMQIPYACMHKCMYAPVLVRSTTWHVRTRGKSPPHLLPKTALPSRPVGRARRGTG